jgi:hypothetical protein
MKKLVLLVAAACAGVGLWHVVEAFPGEQRLSGTALAHLYGGGCTCQCVSCATPVWLTCLFNDPVCQEQGAGYQCDGVHIESWPLYWCYEDIFPPECDPENDYEGWKCVRAIWYTCHCEDVGGGTIRCVKNVGDEVSRVWCAEPNLDCPNNFGGGCVVM